MTQTDQGEFELVLGNKQLLSVFFIVVVLLAVFFFMGYVVGRNSGPTTLARVNGGVAETAVASARPSPMPEAVTPTPVSQTPPSASQASQPEPTPTPAAETPAPTQAEPPANNQEQTAAGPQAVGEPPSGTTWLQVVATTRPDAQLIAETLGRRHFRTQVAPGPNGLFRVLVGPAKNSAEVSELRTKLEADGFRNPMVRKY